MGWLLAPLALLIERVVGYPGWLYRAVGHPVTWIGALLRWLSATPGHSLREREAREMLERDAASLGPPLDDARWTRILAGLERDGLAHRSRGRLRLGVATIGA